MSFRNGDKAREGRLRKQKLARRIANRDLKKTAAASTRVVKSAPARRAE
jgi:hypothetical protein